MACFPCMAHVSVISVVDDDQSVRESLHGFLRSFGFKVRVFTSAEEFLVTKKFDQTDCLILDVRMPGMSGLELQQQLKSKALNIPIIFVTAHGDDETKARAFGGGAVAFLIKPFSEESVLGALNTALNKKNEV
jgi:FixJ family two-component response regulator